MTDVKKQPFGRFPGRMAAELQQRGFFGKLQGGYFTGCLTWEFPMTNRKKMTRTAKHIIDQARALPGLKFVGLIKHQNAEDSFISFSKGMDGAIWTDIPVDHIESVDAL